MLRMACFILRIRLWWLSIDRLSWLNVQIQVIKNRVAPLFSPAHGRRLSLQQAQASACSGQVNSGVSVLFLYCFCIVPVC